MAIQFRRGAFADFIKSKMVAGEPAVVQSGDTSTQNGKAFYICYTPGSVDRVLTEQDKTALDSQISDIEDDLAAAEQTIESVRQSIPAVDATLTTTGAAADAKKTGDEISDLKSDLEQIVPGLSDDAKEALLACFAHVAWQNEHGSDYYDSLYSALYNDQSWLWKYSPADGLLSNQSYMTFSTNATGWSETISNNTLRLFVPQRTDGQGGSWRILYTFGTADSGTLKGLIKTNGLTSAYGTMIMGSRLQISNGTSGVRCAFNAYILDGVRYLEVAYQEETTIKGVRTNLLADEYHEVEVTLDGDNQTIVIDGRLIVASNILSTAATESHVAVQASSDPAAPDGVYLDIKRLWFKENENGGDQ